MPFRLALALSVSVVLIGVAFWFRFDKENPAPPSLVVVKQAGEDERDYEEFVKDFITPKATSTKVESTPLTNTDVIGRELILDYVGLAASGGANEASINAVALNQVEKLRSLIKTTAITANDIKVVSDVSTNYQIYKDTSLDILEGFAATMGEAYGSGINVSGPNPELFSFTDVFSQAYMDTALNLKSISVPSSLVLLHVELVNTYLSNATAMGTISGMSQDPAVSFAGLVILSENMNKEELIIQQMEKIIKSHGI